MKYDTATVPGGCTKFIQAADVAWNAGFKSNMREYYDAWLSQPAGHEYTKSGNMKAPSRPLFCKWVKSAWEAVPIGTVKKSFLSCAITTALDGKEYDDEIHCFKSGQPCQAGRVVLQQKMVKFLSSDDDDDNSNPFASDDDEEETESNELLVDDDDPSDPMSGEESDSEDSE